MSEREKRRSKVNGTIDGSPSGRVHSREAGASNPRTIRISTEMEERIRRSNIRPVTEFTPVEPRKDPVTEERPKQEQSVVQAESMTPNLGEELPPRELRPDEAMLVSQSVQSILVEGVVDPNEVFTDHRKDYRFSRRPALKDKFEMPVISQTDPAQAAQAAAINGARIVK